MSDFKTPSISARLRASVLQQAVEGKLVPQDPSDEPANILLDRIRKERAKLVKEKKAKAPKGGESRIYRSASGSWYEQRGKAAPVCIDTEIPFGIPENWEWTRLGAIAEFGGGGTPDKSNPSFWGGNIPWASMKDIHGDYLVSTLDSITEAGLSSKQSISICEPGELIVSTRLAPGKSIISRIRTSINQDLKVVRIMDIQVGYLHVWFQSNLARFKKLGSGTTVPGIKLDHLNKSLLPVPPVSEQRRIVERINEIMPVINQLEKLEREIDAVDSRFWRELPLSVLQQAVEGKLVPQDPSDEPANILLDRIREERAELIKQKKAKAPKGGESRIYRGANGSWYEQRGKAKPACIDKEIPFGIPDGWTWSRLDSLVSVLNGDRGKNYPAKSKLVRKGIPFVSAGNIEDGTVQAAELLCMTPNQYHALKAGKLKKGDTLFCIRGSLGKHGIYPFEQGAIASSLVIIRSDTESSINEQFLNLLLDSPLTALEIRKRSNGTAQPNLSSKELCRFLYPIPPLAEQRRIAAKVSKIRSVLADRFIASAV